MIFFPYLFSKHPCTDLCTAIVQIYVCHHDLHDVIKWKHFPLHWPFVRRIHRSPVNSPHKYQWSGALMFSSISAWTYSWANIGGAGDLRRHGAHYDVTVMLFQTAVEAQPVGVRTVNGVWDNGFETWRYLLCYWFLTGMSSFKLPVVWTVQVDRERELVSGADISSLA